MGMKCWYYDCKEWRGVREVHSHEEGFVNLCKKHIVLNLKRGTIDTLGKLVKKRKGAPKEKKPCCGFSAKGNGVICLKCYRTVVELTGNHPIDMEYEGVDY